MKKETSFSKLSESEKRIVILKDALKHLKAKRISAETGCVMEVIGAAKDELSTRQLQEIIKEKSCKVCQRGALLFSMVWRSNNFIVDPAKTSFNYANTSFGSFHGEDELVDPFLETLFSEDQLKLMESAFERTTLHGQPKARDFGEQYDSDDDRMEAILKNAIENEGIFKP
jgi:hypothetical protein